MKNFRCIADGLETSTILQQLAAHPELWDQDKDRTSLPNSPHAQSSDIWVRFRNRRELDAPEKFGEPHFAEFYPAWYALPALRPVVFHIMVLLQAVYLGGILITRLAPGARILPHTDSGWHPEFLNAKAYVILKASSACLNFCGDECVILRPGEAWLFNNLIEHSVENNGADERIALILTMRVE